MAGSVQRQKVYVQVTELCLLTKALRAASIPPESPAKARQINPRFTVQVAVIGFAGDVRGEEICAVVVRAPEGGPAPIWTRTPLIAWSKERLGGHKYPRRIRIRPGVVARPERLLRVVTGSIIRSLLGRQAIKLHTSPRELAAHLLTRIPVCHEG